MIRFFTFLKQLSDDTFIKDEEIITFHNWIHSTGLPKMNPHAGVPQISLFILYKPHSKTVWDGFVKTCLAFHEKHPESLPKAIQLEKDLHDFLLIE